MATYTSQYPTQDTDHVKATTNFANRLPHYATDPAKSLTGDSLLNSWVSASGNEDDQRFHIDLGSTKIIRRIYYENYHDLGANENLGVQNFTLWGSNTEASFLELTYGTDTGWTEITTVPTAFDEHVGADQADPKYIIVSNSTAYQYYAFKFVDNYGYATLMGVRRIELQTEDGWTPEISNAIFFGANF